MIKQFNQHLSETHRESFLEGVFIVGLLDYTDLSLVVSVPNNMTTDMIELLTSVLIFRDYQEPDFLFLKLCCE